MSIATFRQMRERQAKNAEAREEEATRPAEAPAPPPKHPVASVPLEPTPGLYEPKGGGSARRASR